MTELLNRCSVGELTRTDTCEEDGSFLIAFTNADGEYHRDNDEPAYTNMHDSGVIERRWYQHGKLHRDEEQPAQEIAVDHECVVAVWFMFGQLHNWFGPAYRDHAGELYSLYDIELTEGEHEQLRDHVTALGSKEQFASKMRMSTAAIKAATISDQCRW
jgi:hypothetical protein